MNRSLFIRIFLACGVLLSAGFARAAAPEWIWHDNKGAKAADNEVRYFRKSFTIADKVTKANLEADGDDEIQVFINGHRVIDASGWDKASHANVAKQLHQGENVIAIRGKNITADAAVIVRLQIEMPKKREQYIVTDTTWLSCAKETPHWSEPDFAVNSSWKKVVSLGKLGVKPWGDVMGTVAATPVDGFKLLPGFKAELIHSSQPGEGSWVSMTVDQKGRLIISPQQGTSNLLRVTLDRNGQVKKMETIDQPVGSAMGLLYAFHSLYVNGAGPKGLGLYRLHDHRLQDKYGPPELIKNIEGAAGEHGSHAVVLGPDKHLYIVSGNFTKVPKDIAADSPHKNYAEDQLLPRGNDGNGFGNGILPPGGFYLRTDKDGKKWQLFAAGTRNTYDFAFNTDGELIAFDSDMEWDWGTPWYRPIRIYHVVSGGDYGFREGTGKWPKYYPDSLPSTVDVGVGSPTGLKFGTDSKFPEKYKKALYALDWAYGRIFAVYLTPSGASYSATFEPFLATKQLNVTDIEFGKDGAMYFITGGRGTQSGLYRVSYVGTKEPEEYVAPSKEELKVAAKARALRHKLEHFQGRQDPKAVEFAWPYLNSDDRFIRYAARIAIESQPVAEWKDRAISETQTNGALTALLALARLGGKETQRDLLLALKKFPLDNLDESQQLAKLRVIELSFIRQGRPDADLAKMAIEKLDSHYPAKSEALNRELCELLVYLQAPDVITKTLALLDAAPTQEEQIHYIFHLRNLKTGWTPEQRRHYFSWFNWEQAVSQGDKPDPALTGDYPWTKRNGGEPEHPAETLKWFKDAGREYADGSSFPKFLGNFRTNAIESLNEAERTELGSFVYGKKPEVVAPIAEHKFVKDWKMEDIEPSLSEVAKGRSFASGKEAFTAAQCAQCHRFDNKGGAVGPELTAISSRFNHHDILESILEPSKVISEQYQNMTIVKKDGDDVTGRIVDEDDKKIVVVVNPLTQTKVEVLKADIDKRVPSKISPMPTGLVNNFTKDEILDLIAYLESGGKETAAAFQKSTAPKTEANSSTK